MTDSKNCSSGLKSESSCLGQSEKRIGLELLAYNRETGENGTVTRWVHSDAQLANVLTTTSELHERDLFVRTGCRWKIVHDDAFRTARRRKALGLGALESQTVSVSVKSNTTSVS